MDRKRWTSFQSQWIVGALVFLWFTAPSFAQSPTEGFSVQKIEVTATPAGSRLAIEGSRSFEYTVFRLNDPLRVVIDLPQAQLGKLAGPLEVKDGTINVIRSRQLDDAQRRAARVEIGLDQMVEYDVNSEGNVLYVNFGKPAVSAAKAPEKTEAAKKAPPSAAVPGKKAKALKGLEISSSEGGVSVGIKGDGEIPDYKSFQLSRPARLVVDLPQMRNASGKRNIDVGSRLLKDIRIGQHQDKLRLVFNFPEAKAPRYQLNREGQDVILTLGDAKAPAEKAQAPEPAKPVQTAQAPAPPAAAPPSKEEAAAPSKETIVIKEETPPAEAKPAESEKTPVGPYRGSRISLDFKDADIHNIFRLIAEVSSLNIITTEDVKGKVTIRLVNVPWDQALDVILAAKNLIKIEEGNVLRITTVDTLRKDREDKQKEEENLVKTRDTKLKLEDPATKVIRLSYADCNDIQRLLLGAMPTGVALPPGMTAGTMKRLLTPQGMVNADKRTNTLIIQDIRGNLEEIEQLVRQLDYPTPQVAIEARVVQAVTTFTRSLGIQWGGSYNQTGSNWYYGLTGHNPLAAPGWGFSPSPPTAGVLPSNFIVNFPASVANTPVGGAAVSFGKLTGNLLNLDLRLSMGETDSLVKVIARPKLATLTNREAHIKQGEKIPYETTSQAGTQVQFIDAVLMLKVTPLVTPDNSVLMKVLVTRDARGSYRSPVNQVPSIDNREASTEVLVKDGETLVIGGIYETDTEETTQGIPWFMKVPVLGWLFKNEERILTKKELLIFITPTIVQKAQI